MGAHMGAHVGAPDGSSACVHACMRAPLLAVCSCMDMSFMPTRRVHPSVRGGVLRSKCVRQLQARWKDHVDRRAPRLELAVGRACTYMCRQVHVKLLLMTTVPVARHVVDEHTDGVAHRGPVGIGNLCSSGSELRVRRRSTDVVSLLGSGRAPYRATYSRRM